MLLTIDTGLDPYIRLTLEGRGMMTVKKIKAERRQAEKLLPAIEALLAAEKLALKDISAIKVNDEGGSFTSLRIGVLTANALAYALKVPISTFSGQKANRFKGGNSVKPRYGGEPNIGKAKKSTWG